LPVPVALLLGLVATRASSQPCGGDGRSGSRRLALSCSSRARCSGRSCCA